MKVGRLRYHEKHPLIMNSSNTALQTGHHHHHHQAASNSVNKHIHQKGVVNQNPSVHQFQSLTSNESPWQLQTQAQKPAQGPTPPLRHHKKAALNPPPPSIAASASLPKPTIQHLSVNSTYNQPVYLTSSAQTQTTPGLATQNILHSQHSPKSPNQGLAQGNLMSTSLNSSSFTTGMINNHHLTSSHHHHHAGTSLNSNNNNSTSFDDLNLNGTSSFANNVASNQKKNDMKLNTMT